MRVLTSLLLLVMGVATAPSITFGQSEAWMVTSSHLSGCRSLGSIAYGNGHFVATTSSMSPSNVVWSRDGASWQFATTVVPNSAQVVFSSGKFSVLASDGLWQSTDGVMWDHAQTFTLNPSNPFRSDLLCAGAGPLLVGNSNPTGVLLYAPDGLNLRPTTPLPHIGSGTLQVNGIVTLGRFFYVAYTVGQNNTWTSHFVFTTDGSDWNDVPWFDWPINAGEIDHGHDFVVAIYAGSSIRFTEQGGVSVTEVPKLGYDHVFYAGNRFFASSSLYATTDGASWGPLATVNLPAGSGIQDVAYGNGRYVAVGTAPQSDLVAYLDFPGPPTVAVPPAAATVVEGRPATFRVEVDQPDARTTYHWKHDGNDIPGATDTGLRLPAATLFDRGEYSVQINNAAGYTATEPVQLTVVPVTQAGRITNVSVLAPLANATDAVTVGFVLGGEHAIGTKPLLIRAIGPSLAPLGVPLSNPDPNLEWYAGSTKTAANDNWGGDPALVELFAQAGAFPLNTDSKDAAYAATAVPLGNNSVWARSSAATGGTVLTELYDYSSASTLTTVTPRLLNVSARKSIPRGGHLTAGFYIAGNTSVTVLIRAVGPTLAQFGVTDAMRDPRLSLFGQGASTPLLTNDDWNGAPELAAAFAAVGAFDIPSNSKDAAILTTLSPGPYSAQADTADAGSVLVEVYEVP